MLHANNRSSNLSRKPILPELIVPGKNLFMQVHQLEQAKEDTNDNSSTTIEHLPESATQINDINDIEHLGVSPNKNKNISP